MTTARPGTLESWILGVPCGLTGVVCLVGAPGCRSKKPDMIVNERLICHIFPLDIRFISNS